MSSKKQSIPKTLLSREEYIKMVPPEIEGYVLAHLVQIGAISTCEGGGGDCDAFLCPAGTVCGKDFGGFCVCGSTAKMETVLGKGALCKRP